MKGEEGGWRGGEGRGEEGRGEGRGEGKEGRGEGKEEGEEGKGKGEEEKDEWKGKGSGWENASYKPSLLITATAHKAIRHRSYSYSLQELPQKPQRY